MVKSREGFFHQKSPRWFRNRNLEGTLCLALFGKCSRVLKNRTCQFLKTTTTLPRTYRTTSPFWRTINSELDSENQVPLEGKRGWRLGSVGVVGWSSENFLLDQPGSNGQNGRHYQTQGNYLASHPSSLLSALFASCCS